MSLRILREHLECCGETAAKVSDLSRKRPRDESKNGRKKAKRKRKSDESGSKKAKSIASMTTNRIVELQASNMRRRIDEAKAQQRPKSKRKANVKRLQRLDPRKNFQRSEKRTRMRGLTQSLLKQITKKGK